MTDEELQKLHDALERITPGFYEPSYDLLEAMRDLLLALAKKAGAK